MSSGGLLLLLGVFALSAELTPVSGQDRPKICYLPPDPGPCKALGYFYYYNPVAKECQRFGYGGCQGNDNRFKTREECQNICVEKPGGCPLSPQPNPCTEKCRNDWECPGEQKCCRYSCLTECKDPVYGKFGAPTKRPSRIGSTVRP